MKQRTSHVSSAIIMVGRTSFKFLLMMITVVMMIIMVALAVPVCLRFVYEERFEKSQVCKVVLSTN